MTRESLVPLEPLDAEALRQILQPLQQEPTWSRWSQALPAIQGARDRVAVIEEEFRRINPLVPFLAQVCWRPRSALRLEEERLPVERARRIPERAVAALLAHPEDWAGRTLRSVHAARILSVVTEDEWALYENRVAVQLLHHLLRWSALRLEWLRRLDRMEREVSDFSGDTGGTHWRSNRLCSLWGALVQDDELARRSRRLREAMEQLRLRLLGLLDAPLCRRLGVPSSESLGLRSTNILTHDPVYRRLVELWRAWLTTEQQARETERERQHKQAQTRQDFGDFTLLLVLRALDSLGYQPTDDASPLDGPDPIELQGPLGRSLLLRSRDEFVFAVGDASLRVVPCPGRLPPDRAETWWHQQRARSASEDRLLLLNGSPDLARDSTLPEAVARALCGWSWPRVLVVSPWSLDSIERVARVLRGWESERRLSQRFPAVERRTDEPIPGAWFAGNSARMVLNYPPTSYELDALETWQRQALAALPRPSFSARAGSEGQAPQGAERCRRLRESTARSRGFFLAKVSDLLQQCQPGQGPRRRNLVVPLPELPGGVGAVALR
jgi:hypothetical protein